MLLLELKRSSACIPARTSSRRAENADSDWSAWRRSGTDCGGGHVVLLLRWPRIGRVVWLAAGGLRRKDERLEEAAEAPAYNFVSVLLA